MIHDIDELIDHMRSLQDALKKLRGEYDNLAKDLKCCRNELCLRCGSYIQAHNGACDGCRWREVG